jgi:hypothetical protein
MRYLAVAVVMLAVASTALASFVDLFQYNPWGNPLAGNGSWLASGTADNRINLRGDPPSGIYLLSDDTWNPPGVWDITYAPVHESGVVTFDIKTRGLGSTNWGSANWWRLELYDNTDTLLASWNGNSAQATSFGWTKSVINPLPAGQQKVLKAVIDIPQKTVDYYFDSGTPNHTDSFTTSGTYIDEIRFTNIGISASVEYHAQEDIYFNQLEITPEPATLSLLALGVLALAGRRRRGGLAKRS